MAEIKNTTNNVEAMRASLTPEQRQANRELMNKISSKYGDTMRALAGQETTFENGVTVNKDT